MIYVLKIKSLPPCGEWGECESGILTSRTARPKARRENTHTYIFLVYTKKFCETEHVQFGAVMEKGPNS